MGITRNWYAQPSFFTEVKNWKGWVLLIFISDYAKKSKFNYRKFYEKQTNKKVPKDFDVHHIDLNRENNDIVNLVAIPKELHQKYHTSLYDIQGKKEYTVNFTIQKNPFVLLYNNHKYLKEWEDLTAVFNATTEVRNWADYRNFLLDTLQPCGNIFHIQHINY